MCQTVNGALKWRLFVTFFPRGEKKKKKGVGRGLAAGVD